MKDGILILDKPSGITSHDCVDIVRRKLKTKKVGHSGTLDPVATGVLVMLVGKYTKLFDKFVSFDKEYEATLKLGMVTSTGDSEGKVLSEKNISHINEDQVRDVFKEFVGEREQVPPMVSAIKHQGKRLYELARKGIEVERKSRPIKIYDLKITRISLPEIDFFVHCSKGTYIRRLGEEIGERLGVGGFISYIRRVSLGPFNIKEAIRIEDLNEGSLRDWKF
ncbi:MAG TPA: tRNA pseudouridine(55) synthase TruB [Candidatus Omnitrophota bacterium]|nr:tRNA pseudouridine(55) synthase TruB [Candidatus Omnitrophota bacterium]